MSGYPAIAVTVALTLSENPLRLTRITVPTCSPSSLNTGKLFSCLYTFRVAVRVVTPAASAVSKV